MLVLPWLRLLYVMPLVMLLLVVRLPMVGGLLIAVHGMFRAVFGAWRPFQPFSAAVAREVSVLIADVFVLMLDVCDESVVPWLAIVVSAVSNPVAIAPSSTVKSVLLPSEKGDECVTRVYVMTVPSGWTVG